MNKLGIGKKYILYVMTVLFVGSFVGFLVLFRNELFVKESGIINKQANGGDASYGWKFPVSEFQPITGRVRDMGAYSKLRDDGGIPRGLPVRLIIPKIGVNTAIEDAQITSSGRMDVPEGSVNVAWFSLGPQPGQVGSAVIGGHYGKQDGIPFVFYDLDKLDIGDRVYVVDDYGNNLEFVVRTIRLYDRNADATTVFVSNDGIAHLNLITCEGIWNKVNDTYPERRVVFADMVVSSANSRPVSAVTTISTVSFGESGVKTMSINQFFKKIYENPTYGVVIFSLFGFIVIGFSRLGINNKSKLVKRKR